MPGPTTALNQPTTVQALQEREAAALAKALGSTDDVSVFVDGTTLRLPAGATEAVHELLHRLAAGQSVQLSSVEAWLNTSQAAAAAGISASYLRKVTEAGQLPVAYRGTHRRYRAEDIAAWVRDREAQRLAGEAERPAGEES